MSALLFVLGVTLGFLLALASLKSNRPRTLPPEVIDFTAWRMARLASSGAPALHERIRARGQRLEPGKRRAPGPEVPHG